MINLQKVFDDLAAGLEEQGNAVVNEALDLFYDLELVDAINTAHELGFNNELLTKEKLAKVFNCMELTDEIYPVMQKMREKIGLKDN